MYEEMTKFVSDATSSDFFAGGLALGALGAAVAVSRAVLGRIYALIWARVAVSVELDNRGTVFRYFALWLSETDALKRSKRWRMVGLKRSYDDDEQQGQAIMVPGNGRHWFFRDGCLCIIHSSMNEKAKITTTNHRDGLLEKMSVTLIGAGRDRLSAWVLEGRRMAESQTRIGPALHVYGDDYWNSVGDIPRRALDTIVTEGNVAQTLVADVERFYDARQWYADRGVPWRRGYLLYGPPGTGKSSLIRAVASELNRDIATLEIGSARLSDEGLRTAMFDAPRNAVLVMEDIDAVFNARNKGEESGVSFSGLLNAIDGVAAQEGRALFLTTNHKERLDPALIRAGRADLHVKLGLIGAREARKLFLRFFPQEVVYAIRFERALGDICVAPATVQGWLLQHAEDVAIASSAAGLIPQPLNVAAE